MVRFAKILALVIFALSIFGGWAWDDVLVTDRPTTPTGNFVVAHAQHGGVSYVSAADEYITSGIWLLMAVSGVVGGCLYLIEGKNKRF
jgi:hypothetical protein